MFNQSTIKTSLYGLVGWRESLLTEYAILTDTNKVTSSGMYFQDFHPGLVTIENIHNVAPEGLSDADFNTWLANITKASIVKVVDKITKRVILPTGSLLENVRLFDQENVNDTVMTLSGNAFVGYEIDLSKNNNIQVIVNTVGACFDSTGADAITLYLFQSSQSDAVKTQLISFTADVEKWQALTDFLCNYVTDDYVGGKFYIGYKQQDLSGKKPINRTWNASNTENLTKMFGIRSIKVTDYDDTKMFDPDDVEYVSDTWGLNFSFTSKIDLSKLITEQKDLFTQAIGYQVAFDILGMLANSIRNNAIKKETRDMALLELEGAEGKTGLRKELKDSINQVDIDLSGLDNVCLPKKSRINTYTLR